MAVVYDYQSVSAGENVTVWAPSEDIQDKNFTAEFGKVQKKKEKKKWNFLFPFHFPPLLRNGKKEVILFSFRTKKKEEAKEEFIFNIIFFHIDPPP